MKNSKLIRVIKTFNKSEFKLFGKFVSSPYFSTGRNVRPLFEILSKFYPHFKNEDFSKENIIGELSRLGYKATPGLLKTQMSEMYRLAEKFMTLDGSKNETGVNTFYFAKNCRKRSLYSLVEPKINSSLKAFSAGGIDGNYFQNYYFGKVEMINYYFMNDKAVNGADILNDMSEVLLHSFLCSASRYLYNLIIFKMQLNVDRGNSLLFNFLSKVDLEYFLKSLESRDDRFSKASSVYILFILMFLEPDNDDNYFRFKEKLFQNISIFSFYDQSFLLQIINFRAEKRMAGLNYLKFAEETFEIINFRLNNSIYKQDHDSYYTANEFHTAFYIGFILRRNEWLKNFMKQHIDEVPADQKDSCTLACNAFICFLEGNYTGCLQNINHLKAMTISLAIDTKRLQLMALYEAGYDNEAFYALEAFRGFINKNRNVSEEAKKNNTNFMKLYINILRHKYKEEDSDLKKLRIRAQSSETANQEWIVEKITELIRKH